MAKPNSVRDTKRLCADACDLIDQSATLISGSDAACAVHKDQIEKSKEAVSKSRAQILRLRLRAK
jgi:hypothetical protein